MRESLIPADVYQYENHHQNIKTVKAYIQHIQRALRKTRHDGKKLKSKPTYLIAGSDGSGKSTLLQQAELNTIAKYNQHQHPETLQGLQNNVYITQDANYIELNTNLDDYPFNHSNFLPEHNNVKGVLLCIDMQAMFNPEHCQQQTRVLQNTISILAHAFNKQIPVTLLFTKSDMIRGFNEFFSDLDEEQRQRAWGFEFSKQSHLDWAEFEKVLLARYKKFVKDINEHMLWALQHEASQHNRVLIHEFPLQLESLQSTIFNILRQLHGVSLGRIKACYFCSSQQQGLVLDRLAGPLQQVFQLPVANHDHRHMLQRPYFINGVLNSRLNLIASSHSKKAKRVNRTLYAGAGLALVCGILGWGYLLQQDLRQLNIAGTKLAQYTAQTHSINTKNISIDQLLPILNSLNQVVTTVNAHPTENTILNLFQLNANTKLATIAERQYQQTLRSSLLPFLHQQLEANLQNDIAQTSNNLYSDLRAYLMLGENQHMQVAEFTAWAKAFALNTLQLTPVAASNFIKHIKIMLSQKLPEQDINYDLVAKSRHTLATLPKAMLANMLLLAQTEISQASPLLAQPQDVFSLTRNSIPYRFTNKGIETLNSKTSQKIVQQTLHGDWVLGENATSNSATEQQALKAKLKDLYQQSYASWWHTTLNDSTFNKFQSLQQLQQALTELTNTNSPLKALLTAIRNNTNLSSNSNIALQFSEINQLALPGKDNIAYRGLQDKLDTLSQYIASINNSNNPARAAFDAVKKRIQPKNFKQNPISQLELYAADLPRPVSIWMQQLARNSWRLLMQQSSVYINQQWLDVVATPFKQKAAGLYPFNADSKNQISLQDFSLFFAPSGSIQSFYQNYIAFLLTTDNGNWTPRNIDGTKMPFSDKAIQLFERAHILTLMFFPNNSEQPEVHFSMRPIAVKPGITSISLTVGGSSNTDYPSGASTHLLRWPGVGNKKDYASLVFKHANNQVNTEELHGPWALFKLLETAQIQANKDPKKYSIIFSHKGDAVKYQLNAETAINPFMRGIINHVVCPSTLIES